MRPWHGELSAVLPPRCPVIVNYMRDAIMPGVWARTSLIVFYRSLVENHDVGPELVYDDWAARVISPCLVVRPYDDIEWKRVRCGRAPSRLQLSGRSSCSSSS